MKQEYVLYATDKQTYGRIVSSTTKYQASDIVKLQIVFSKFDDFLHAFKGNKEGVIIPPQNGMIVCTPSQEVIMQLRASQLQYAFQEQVYYVFYNNRNKGQLYQIGLVYEQNPVASESEALGRGKKSPSDTQGKNTSQDVGQKPVQQRQAPQAQRASNVELSEDYFLKIKQIVKGHQDPKMQLDLFQDLIGISPDAALFGYQQYEAMGMSRRMAELQWRKEIAAKW